MWGRPGKQSETFCADRIACLSPPPLSLPKSTELDRRRRRDWLADILTTSCHSCWGKGEKKLKGGRFSQNTRKKDRQADGRHTERERERGKWGEEKERQSKVTKKASEEREGQVWNFSIVNSLCAGSHFYRQGTVVPLQGMARRKGGGRGGYGQQSFWTTAP